MGIIREPEGVDFVVIDKPMTKAELKEFSAFIKEYKRTHKMEWQKNSPHPIKKKKIKKYSGAESHKEMVSEPKPAYTKRKPDKKHKKAKKYA